MFFLNILLERIALEYIFYKEFLPLSSFDEFYKINIQMNIAKAGSLGPKTRSDCEVQIELTDKGGIVIDLKSKVDVMFGKANRKLINDVLKHFEMKMQK